MRRNDVLMLMVYTLLFSSCYVTRAYQNRKFKLKSLENFEVTKLPPSPTPFHFRELTQPPLPKLNAYLDTNLSDSKTYAFLVIRNDSILYEKYFDNLTFTQQLPSFSVAKSFISTLIGIAIDEGKIHDVHESITQYIPSLAARDKRFNNITIQDLLDMRSGINSNENYVNPFSDVLKLGFTKNINPITLSVKYGKDPGTFEYRSVNTQLLAMVLENATGEKVQDYMTRKLWLPLGMEYPASWNIDDEKHNTVKAFCCINAAARDFAKFGRLFIEKGQWEGKRIISDAWINRSTDKDTFNVYGGYKNQWWSGKTVNVFTDSTLANNFSQSISGNSRIYGFNTPEGLRNFAVQYRDGAFHAEGLLEQYVYINPVKHLVIVRLGYNWKHPLMDSETFIYNLGKNL
jgi:CubicO group peptidase (beta-lactamase class C family)